ncbi:Hypothetical protein NTJ_08518 [Nesidiocoris tenuis]|uniref:Uncharacterized protein n=1 Tax=Nesidiocoris tenuis TaxID=355587 RepID=A0ABN7AU30_9HEMI|nr:Hypothetical protein NTJ_08518 [Nesidiocoris tenuis]
MTSTVKEEKKEEVSDDSTEVKDKAAVKTENDDEVKDDDDKKENGDDKEDDEKNDEADESAEDGKRKKEPFKYKDNFSGTAEEHEQSPYIWVKSKILHNALNKSLEASREALKKIFEEDLGVGIPKLKMPELSQLYLEMRSTEDKFKVLSSTNRPERYMKKGPYNSSNELATQSVVVKEEDFGNAKPGTIEEALDELLPLRKTLYKEQLALKTKELEETAEKATAIMQENQAKKSGAASKKVVEKPKVDSVVPMVPNVGYERNVSLNFEKEGKAKKIRVGIRVNYEKDGVKKISLVPVSECAHIAPQIVKAAEALADHFTKEKFEVFNGKEAGKDLYGVKISMNEIGEILMSPIVVIDAKFTEEFYDLNEPLENLPQDVQDHFARVEAKQAKLAGKKTDDKADDKTVKKEDAKEDDEEGEKEDDEEEKAEEEDDAEADAKEGEAKAGESEDQIKILREGLPRPTTLEKTPFLRRVRTQIEESISKFGSSMKKFFEEKGPSLGVSGMYLTWHATNKRPTDWSRNVKHWYHVCGSTSMTETVNSIKTEIFPYLDVQGQHRTQSVPAVCNAIIENWNVGSNTSAVVACDQFIVQKLFAQKCKKVAVFSSMNDVARNELKSKHQDALFISARANKLFNIVDKVRRHFNGIPDLIVHWGNFQEMPLKKIIQQRPKHLAVVLDPRDRDPRWVYYTNVDAVRKNWMSLSAHYTLKSMAGIDICPMKSGSLVLVAFYDALPGRPNFNRGVKRKNNVPVGPGPKRNMGGGYQNRPNHQNQRNMGPMGGQKRFGGPGGGGGPGGYKKPRIDNRRPPPAPLPRGPMNRSGGGGGGPRFNSRPGPNPWNDSRRMDNVGGGTSLFNNRNTGGGGGGYNDNPPAEHTVQAAKAVLSQLNSIIENQIMLANINVPGQGPRNRPDDSWSGGGRRDSGFGGFQNDQDYFSRDRSPPNNSISTGGGFERRGYGGNSSGGGGGGSGNRRNNSGGGGGGRFGGGGGGGGGRFNRSR